MKGSPDERPQRLPTPRHHHGHHQLSNNGSRGSRRRSLEPITKRIPSPRHVTARSHTFTNTRDDVRRIWARDEDASRALGKFFITSPSNNGNGLETQTSRAHWQVCFFFGIIIILNYYLQLNYENDDDDDDERTSPHTITITITRTNGDSRRNASRVPGKLLLLLYCFNYTNTCLQIDLPTNGCWALV